MFPPQLFPDNDSNVVTPEFEMWELEFINIVRRRFFQYLEYNRVHVGPFVGG